MSLRKASGCIFSCTPSRWHHWSFECSLHSGVQTCSFKHWRKLQPSLRSVFNVLQWFYSVNLLPTHHLKCCWFDRPMAIIVFLIFCPFFSLFLCYFSAGYFTAPVQGVYYFTFTSHCWHGNEDCGSSLLLNENKVVSWYGSDDHNPQSGSNSAVLQLQVGDNVSVRVWHNRRISDNHNRYCSFSGFWLFPL